MLVLFDLNGFKTYNDTFGHPAGDALLSRLAAKLAAAVAPDGTAYRMGGDEFCVLLPAPRARPPRGSPQALCESGEGFDVTSAYGAALIPDDATTVSTALSVADERLYAHKELLAEIRRGTAHEPLLRTLAEREPELRAHVADVSSLAVRVGQRLGLAPDELEELRLAAELHDVGKLAIPDVVLQKAGPLDPTEWGFIHSHTLIGQRILSAAPALRPVGAIVRSTHENWDGTGYPDGLAGEAIPLAARIIAVCDAYSAMTSDRPYRAARTPDEAIAELRRCAGQQFDRQVVELLCTVLADEDEPATTCRGRHVTTKGRDRSRPFAILSDLSCLGGEDELVAERELEPREGVALELPDALPRQAELLADRLERGGLGVEAEAQLDDAPLPLGQVRDRALYALPADRLDSFLGGIDRRLVGEQVAELRVAVRAETLVQGDGVDGVECLDDVLELEPRRLGELLRRRLAAQLGLQLGRGAVELDAALLDVHRDADRLRLVRDRALAGLTDPPGRVGRELVALAPVELLRGAVEADHALLDQVQERHVVALVALRDRDDQAKVGVDHLLLRCEVAPLDALRERNLVGGREQLVPARCVHEELQRVERARDGCGCDRARLLRRLLAHDDVALFERGAESR